MKALIIDDEKDICFLLQIILQQKNIPTDCVYRLADAAEALKSDRPSIIFLDNHLPDGYGVDFVDRIKVISPDSKIVMITAHDSPDDKNKALKKGVDVFLGKPFTLDSIGRAVDKLAS
ncbi:response regulator [Pollutibacter soli]|uniref:response regulator n=1 Tax=Pollutibacter soli TaxID=3034157 RepID=UPI003013A044